MHSTLWQASLENFKIKSRLQLQYVYFSAEALFGILFWHIISAARSSDRLYWLEDTLPAVPQGLLLLNYATEFSNPKDGEADNGEKEGGGRAESKSLYKFSKVATSSQVMQQQHAASHIWEVWKGRRKKKCMS